MISNEHKKTWKSLNYIEHSIIASAVPGCISISAIASLFVFPIGITSSATELKICVITAGIKKHKSIVTENKKSMIRQYC